MILFDDAPPQEWNSEHAAALKAVLESDIVKLALQWVAFHGPKLLDGTDVNKTLVASGEVKGYSNAIKELFSLTREQPAEVQPPEAYPSLDDDSKWNDQPKTPDKP